MVNRAHTRARWSRCFLFIVMLLDMHGGDRKPFKRTTHGGQRRRDPARPRGAGFCPAGAAPLRAGRRRGGRRHAQGVRLRSCSRPTCCPVQIVGFLLLIAMLGVIVLSKKFEGLEDVK
jgi:NADH-quinone oxidoreductase subunit J